MAFLGHASLTSQQHETAIEGLKAAPDQRLLQDWGVCHSVQCHSVQEVIGP